MAPFFDPPPTAGGGLHAPATARNREPILGVLRGVLPSNGTVLEIASGTGEHAVFFARAFPSLTWQPSDLEERNLASIAVWRRESGLPNVASPVCLDAEAESWAVERADAVVAINMIHIAPWSACEGLLRGAARTLAAGGVLFLYGPFKERGEPLAESNARFDERLRSEDPRWGLRELDDVIAVAAARGLRHDAVVRMPANNLSVVFHR